MRQDHFLYSAVQYASQASVRIALKPGLMHWRLSYLGINASVSLTRKICQLSILSELCSRIVAPDAEILGYKNMNHLEIIVVKPLSVRKQAPMLQFMIFYLAALIQQVTG